ncbi:HD domain-containing phosphohydrolase [Mucisphaera sp.]|uniref:HD domain-containing phosphohydrolase n=1 Tax=Mucisphaera sp. TaxID=2913024 RepID=UPI003D0E7465
MPTWFSRRWLIIGGLLLSQLAASIVAIIALDTWAEQALADRVESRVSQLSQNNAYRFEQIIDELDLPPLATDPQTTRNRLQRLVDRLPLTVSGYLSVLDASNHRVIAAPSSLNLPQQDNTPLGDLILQTDEALIPISDITGPTVGRLLLNGREQIVTIRPIPQRGLTVVAHHSQASITAEISQILGTFRLLAITVAGLILLITGGATLWFVRSSENQLKTRQQSLERELNQQFIQRSKDIERGRDAVVFGLARLAESRDDQTGQHLERISLYAEAIARQLSRTHPAVSDTDVEIITTTAPLHDIGKVGIPDAVLLKPGPLTDEERAIIERHPYIGGDTLVEIKQRWGADGPFLDTACEIIFAHHEKWDGSGYPYGLKETNIPLSARIVAVADVYDALTSARPYKPAMPHDQASQIIRENAGAHFDPEVVEAFLRIDAEIQQIAQKMTDPPSPQKQPEA